MTNLVFNFELILWRILFLISWRILFLILWRILGWGVLTNVGVVTNLGFGWRDESWVGRRDETWVWSLLSARTSVSSFFVKTSRNERRKTNLFDSSWLLTICFKLRTKIFFASKENLCLWDAHRNNYKWVCSKLIRQLLSVTTVHFRSAVFLKQLLFETFVFKLFTHKIILNSTKQSCEYKYHTNQFSTYIRPRHFCECSSLMLLHYNIFFTDYIESLLDAVSAFGYMII